MHFQCFVKAVSASCDRLPIGARSQSCSMSMLTGTPRETAVLCASIRHVWRQRQWRVAWMVQLETLCLSTLRRSLGGLSSSIPRCSRTRCYLLPVGSALHSRCGLSLLNDVFPASPATRRDPKICGCGPVASPVGPAASAPRGKSRAVRWGNTLHATFRFAHTITKAFVKPQFEPVRNRVPLLVINDPVYHATCTCIMHTEAYSSDGIRL